MESSVDINKVKEALELSNDELLLNIGGHFTGIGVSEERPDRLKDVARKWLASKNTEIRNAVCKNEKIRSAANMADDHERKLNLVCLIADALAASFVRAPVISIAVLTTREGLDYFCKNEWQ